MDSRQLGWTVSTQVDGRPVRVGDPGARRTQIKHGKTTNSILLSKHSPVPRLVGYLPLKNQGLSTAEMGGIPSTSLTKAALS